MSGMIAILLRLAVQDGFSVGPVERAGDARVRKVTVKRGPSDARGGLHVFFSDDAVLVGEPRGYVRRLSYPDLRPGAEARLTASVSSYALSRSGLLALSQSNRELSILDVQRLAVTKAIPLKAGSLIASSPAMDVAFVNIMPGLVTVDLDSGQVVREHDPRKLIEDFGRRVKRPEGEESFVGLHGFPAFACSPDGSWLFSGDASLNRFRISGLDLLYEEISPKRGTYLSSIQVSPDSRTVGLPGNGVAPSVILDAADLQKKVAVIPEDHGLTALVADSARERVIGVEERRSGTQAMSLSIFSFDGRRVATFPLGSGSLRRLAVHPSGQAALVVCDESFYLVDWK